MNLFIILGALLVGLIIMVNLAKWIGPAQNDPKVAKLSRFIFPLLAVGFIIQLLILLFK